LEEEQEKDGDEKDRVMGSVISSQVFQKVSWKLSIIALLSPFVVYVVVELW
jgi:hypothetical protein